MTCAKRVIHRGRLETEFLGPPGVGEHLGRSDQGLARHAAGVQAVAAHLVFFDQGHPGAHRGSDVGGHQAGGSGPDHHQVVIEGLGPGPSAIDAPLLYQPHPGLGEQGKQAEQGKRKEQAGRQDIAQRGDGGQPGAGVDVHQRSGQHPQLTDEIEHHGSDRREAHDQVDDEKWKDRHQPQGEQVKCTVLGDAGIDGGQLVSEPVLNGIPQQKARDPEGQRGADGRGEADDDQAGAQAEQRAAGQRHDRGSGQRQGGHDHIGDKIDGQGQRGMGSVKLLESALLLLQILQGEVGVQIQGEKNRRGRDNGRQQQTSGDHGFHRTTSRIAERSVFSYNKAHPREGKHPKAQTGKIRFDAAWRVG